MTDIQNLSSEIDIRKAKIQMLKESGEVPFKEKFEKNCEIKDVKEKLGEKVKIAGRIVARRIMGKFGFMKLSNIEGVIQVSVGRNELEEERYVFYKKMIDIGDFVGVEGEVYTTQTGEITVRCEKLTLLSKSMRPLPEKFHGLVDIEAKYRQRYLDTIMNEDARNVILGRSKVLSFTRRFLEKNNFIEVETPILQTAVCGASAKPFFTKHNALDKICNLRIAPETYLKQVIASGFDRTFEIAKVFRNEGMDPQHLQEFTMCEWYASYWNFEDNIKFFQEFFRGLLKEVVGKTTISFQGHELDFAKDWDRVNYTERMIEIFGFDFLQFENVDKFIAEIEKHTKYKADDFEGIKTIGGIVDYVYKREIRPSLVQPTVLYNYPAFLIPLARRNDQNDKLIDVFQVVVLGSELCKAYSELVDPVVQREAFEVQVKAKAEGDDEAMDLDEGFMLAMEHGMPPISGLGFGVDRIMVLLFDQPSVRDVVFFPLMK